MKYSYDASENMTSQTLANVSPSQITGQPVRQVVEPGDFATFSVKGADANGVTFQWKWKFNGIDIPGATGDSLLLTPMSAPLKRSILSVVTKSAASAMPL